MNFIKNEFYILCMFFISMVLSSCEKSVNIKLPFDGHKMVLNSIITNDSLVYAHITRNEPNESNVNFFYELENCKVDLYENDVFKETLALKMINGKKYYVSDHKAKSANKYTIKAALTNESLVKDLPNVEGSDVIPVKPSFEPLEFWQSASTQNNQNRHKLTLKLKDPGGIKNYYRLRVFSANYNNSTRRYTINKNNEQYFTIDNFKDQNSIFGAFDEDGYGVNYFTDETFDGQEITLTLTLNRLYNNQGFIAPELVSMSRSAYLYFDSKKKQSDNEDNPFTEAVVVYNNIQNGYGIVGGIADSLAVIKRRD